MDRITNQSPRQRGYGSTSSLRNDSLKHTRKHERRKGGIEPRNKALRLWQTVRPGGADRPHGPRGPSGLLPRTVRTLTANRPALRCGPSEKANRTCRDDPRKTDRPRRPGGPSARVPDRLLLKLGPSANRLQRKPKTKPDRKQRRARTRRTCEEHCARGPSARPSRTVRQGRIELKTARPRKSTLPIQHRISQMLEAVETRVWGYEKRQPRMLYPKNFVS
jgi:hypothetical protein